MPTISVRTFSAPPKWIKRYEGGFSLKPRVGVKSQLFRETKDEKWGHGLYDFRRYEAGLTFERKTRFGLSTPWLYQLSWDAYYTSYVRFKSLASQYGQELSSPDPGTKTLDTLTNQFSYDSEFDLPGFMKADFFFAVSLIDFRDQKVINSAGSYLSSNRSDSFATLGLGLSKRFNDFSALGGIRPALGAGVNLSNLNSNQNHLDTDPKHLRFVDGFYDYWETRVSPNAQFTLLSSRVTVRLSYDFAMRQYTGRLAQQSDGTYEGKKLSQFSHGLGFELAWPLAAALDLKMQGNWSSSSSNNRYEQVYRYNYNSAMYFAGLEWRI